MIPHCPRCKESLDCVEYKVNEYYDYDKESQGYSNDDEDFCGDAEVQCTQCNLDLAELGIGYGRGPVNFDVEEYLVNIKEVESWY